MHACNGKVKVIVILARGLQKLVDRTKQALQALFVFMAALRNKNQI
jgi:hypothetical protein